MRVGVVVGVDRAGRQRQLPAEGGRELIRAGASRLLLEVSVGDHGFCDFVYWNLFDVDLPLVDLGF
jgi:hypothetical protein